MESPRTAALSCLVWRSRGWLCALPVEHVAEILRPLPVEKLADAPPSVAGVAIIRGRPTPIIDTALLIADSEGEPARFVVVRIDARRSIALAVDEVLGVREVLSAQLADLPPLLRESGRASVARIGSLDAELLVVLEAARILPDSAWPAMAGGIA